jgi:hypothetical protein
MHSIGQATNEGAARVGARTAAQGPPPRPSPAVAYAAKLKGIRRELRDEYLQAHDKPWIVGFSGGKDSTLLARLAMPVQVVKTLPLPEESFWMNRLGRGEARRAGRMTTGVVR